MTEPLAKINTTRRSSGTWRSDTSTTSSTASRYNLDEEDTSPILTYVYGGDISTTSQKDLCDLLDHDMNHRQRVTKKEIPRFATNLEVKRHDLWLGTEQDEYRNLPNYDSSLASIRLPSNVYWGRLLFGQYDNLYIVSPETTPDNSEAGSVRGHFDSSSTPFSPVSSQGDAQAGAARE